MNRLKLIIAVLVLLLVPISGLLILEYLGFDIRSIFEAFREIQLAYLIGAIILALIPWFTNSLRLSVWSRFFGHDVSWRKHLRTTMSAEVGAALTPTAVGGTPVKIAMLVRSGLPSGAAFTIVSICSLEDIIFFATILPVIFAAKWDLLPQTLQLTFSQIGTLLPFGAVAISAFFVTPRRSSVWLSLSLYLQRFTPISKLINKLNIQFFEIARLYSVIGKEGKRNFLKTLPITAVQWLSRYSILTLLVAGAGLDVDFLLFFLLQWSIFTLGALIPTPGGSGGLETLCFLLFYSLVPGTLLPAMVLMWRFVSGYLLLGLDLVLLLTSCKIAKRFQFVLKTQLVPNRFAGNSLKF